MSLVRDTHTHKLVSPLGFPRLALLPAESRRDGPSKPIPSGELCGRLKTRSDSSALAVSKRTRPCQEIRPVNYFTQLNGSR